MGSEDLHHRRKKRTHNSLERKISRRKPYDLVLIVCEGKKSEPNYLKGLLNELKLNTANVKVLGLGVDPLTIVENAIAQYGELREFDRVFCVFDKDNHTSYNAALTKIASVQKSIPITAITSVPCFEYWLLLHYVDTRKPYNGTDNKSAAQQVLSEIKSHIPSYAKGQTDIFKELKSRTCIAIKNAKKIDALQGKDGCDNPSTKMHTLVEYLMKIKN